MSHSRRDLAATGQAAFTLLLVREAERFRDVRHDGLVLTGGCALNVVTNQHLRERWSKPVWAPPAPNDSGIAVGALWAIEPPRASPGAFHGLPLVMDTTETELARRGARRCSARGLAEAIRHGAVVGVAHGRAEHGPRAFGHRLILALAGDATLRDRINQRIKSREWSRPVAPVVRQCDVERYFEGSSERSCAAPYMSFAPRLRAGIAERHGSIAHLDGTARGQTTTKGTFLHQLLDDIADMKGEPLIVNTSFNLRGRPMVHRASEALSALDEAELDFVWMQGWLIPKNADQFARFQVCGAG